MGNSEDRIMDVIAKNTNGKSYQSHRFCYDAMPRPGIEYDLSYEEKMWSSKGETVDQKNNNVNLKKLADDISSDESILKYFLDGSRHVYKIDDISYNDAVYPVVAGQIGIGCCSRKNGELHKELYDKELVIALPEIANDSQWYPREFFDKLKSDVNSIQKLKKIGINFDEILTYNIAIKNKETLEDHGIARIQDRMIELEKNAVAKLVDKNRLSDKSYLIKDGSLEYQKLNVKCENPNDLSNKKFRGNYSHVIGVSKSFNPAQCKSADDKPDSSRVANLKQFERTPVNMYHSERAGNVYFAVWYVRLRDAKFSNNVFSGVLKIQKIVESDDNGGIPVPTDDVNMITASILNERNPVCYGSDERWANHIYPIYLTESFVKSKYLSSNLFMELF